MLDGNVYQIYLRRYYLTMLELDHYFKFKLKLNKRMDFIKQMPQPLMEKPHTHKHVTISGLENKHRTNLQTNSSPVTWLRHDLELSRQQRWNRWTDLWWQIIRNLFAMFNENIELCILISQLHLNLPHPTLLAMCRSELRASLD